MYQFGNEGRLSKIALIECPDSNSASRLLSSPPEALEKLNVELVNYSDFTDYLPENERLLCALLEPKSLILKNALRRDFSQPHQLHRSGFGQYVANKKVFESVCDRLNTLDSWKGDRVPFAVAHGTPGFGKSALLDHLAYCVTQYQRSKRGEPFDQQAVTLLSDARDWPERSVVVSITFDPSSNTYDTARMIRFFSNQNYV